MRAPTGLRRANLSEHFRELPCLAAAQLGVRALETARELRDRGEDDVLERVPVDLDESHGWGHMLRDDDRLARPPHTIDECACAPGELAYADDGHCP